MSLVTIPIRVYPATNPAATIHFNQLHRECQSRIVYKKWCPVHTREVSNDEIVKGYEFERGRYVALEEDEIAKVRPESTRVIHLQQFATAAAVDQMLLEQPYYLAPDGKVAAESFAVMREALRGQAAIGTVAFHGREHLVAIEPRDDVLVMFVLRHEDEIRKVDSLPLDDVPTKVKPEEVALAKKVMGGFDATIDFSRYHDTYEDALRKMIDAKIAGEEIIATPEAPQPKVVNLMDALRKSLDEVSKTKKRSARATPAPKPRRGKVSKFSARKRAS